MVNTDTKNWNTVQRYYCKKMKYHQKSMSMKHKYFGDTPLLAADGNFADPAATEDSGCPPPSAPSDKIFTELMVNSDKKSNIEMLYDSDPESFFHTRPIYVKTSTRKESIFAGKDTDHNRYRLIPYSMITQIMTSTK